MENEDKEKEIIPDKPAKPEKDNTQLSLFKDEDWQKEWQDMPEYIQEDLTSFKRIKVHFFNRKDMDKFSKLVGQRITTSTQYLWYPKRKAKTCNNRKYIDKP